MRDESEIEARAQKRAKEFDSSLNKKFNIIVPIKEDLMKCLIFGQTSREPVRLILSFYGHQKEVLPLM